MKLIIVTSDKVAKFISTYFQSRLETINMSLTKGRCSESEVTFTGSHFKGFPRNLLVQFLEKCHKEFQEVLLKAGRSSQMFNRPKVLEHARGKSWITT